MREHTHVPRREVYVSSLSLSLSLSFSLSLFLSLKNDSLCFERLEEKNECDVSVLCAQNKVLNRALEFRAQQEER